MAAAFRRDAEHPGEAPRGLALRKVFHKGDQ
jgi:hypothetical protein